MKIGVMLHSGEVYNHDCVRWYQYQEVQKNLRHYHNIGDAFVYDSSLKLLRYDDIKCVEIRNPQDADIERINAECDYILLRGSNYINPFMKWANAADFIKKLRIPVLAFGIGAQAPSEGPLILSEETKQILRMIADSTASIGVRGVYTAEVLWDLGIKNARIIGCPTAFRNNNPDLRITLPPLDTVRNVGITMRREVSEDYAQSIEQYLNFHRDLVKTMASRFSVSLMMQGEVEEKMILWGTDEQREEAWTTLRHNGWLQKWFLDAEIEELYRTKLWYSDVVSEWADHVRSKDLVLGYRLHGNLMALANGIPSVYFTYDSRTVEFAQTFAIPCHDVFSAKEFRLEDYWCQSLFEKFNRAYHQRYRDMSLFLDENAIPHKMHAEQLGKDGRKVPSAA